MINERCKLPLKVALALTLALVGALWLGWDRAYWAGFSVVVMSVTETSGHSFRKGRHRLIGTLIGVAVAFVLVANFAQQPIVFLIAFTSFAALCLYLLGDPRRGYIWSMTLTVASLILMMGGMTSDLTFHVAALRLQETLLGILSFTVVFSVLWPVSSRNVFQSTLMNFFRDQRDKVTHTLDDSRGQSLGFGDGLRLVTRLEDLLTASITDSYQISDEKENWRSLLALCQEWTVLNGHLSDSVELLEPSTLDNDRQKIQELLDRVSVRLLNAEIALNEGVSKDNPLPMPVKLTSEAVSDPQQHSDSLQLEKRLNELDRLSDKIVNVLYSALGLELKQFTLQPKAQVNRFSLDIERLCTAFKGWLLIWLCIALWIFVPWTGGAMVALIGVVIMSAISSMPFIETKWLFRNVLCWSVVILFQFVFLMPLFSEVWQLAAFYFVNTFVIWYWLAKPQQVLDRMLGTQLLVMMTMGALKLQPDYDFQSALLKLFIISVVVVAFFFINYLVFSSRPERVFLRHLKLLHHLFARQIRLVNFCGSKPKRTSHLFGQLFLGQSPLRSLGIMEQALTRIDWSKYPDVDKDKTHQIIYGLYGLTLRLISLQNDLKSGEATIIPAQVTMFLQEAIITLSNIIERSGDISHLNNQEDRIDKIQYYLHQSIQSVGSGSGLPISLSEKQTMYIYQILGEVKLMTQNIKNLASTISQSNVSSLQYNHFLL